MRRGFGLLLAALSLSADNRKVFAVYAGALDPNRPDLDKEINGEEGARLGFSALALPDHGVLLIGTEIPYKTGQALIEEVRGNMPRNTVGGFAFSKKLPLQEIAALVNSEAGVVAHPACICFVPGDFAGPDTIPAFAKAEEESEDIDA